MRGIPPSGQVLWDIIPLLFTKNHNTHIFPHDLDPCPSSDENGSSISTRCDVGLVRQDVTLAIIRRTGTRFPCVK